LASDFDVTLVREQSEGMWMAPEFWVGDVGCSVARASKTGSERIARFAFEEARRLKAPTVTCVHKANISRIFFGQFRQAFRHLAVEYPDVELVEMHTDVLPLELIRNPSALHVVATTNMYGDAISGELAGLVGGLGMLPSAEYGTKGAIFRPAHGTAPDLAGKGLVNPTAMFMALQIMLAWLGSRNQDEALLSMSRRLDDSLTDVFVDRLALTADVGGNSTTAEMTSAVAARIRSSAEVR
jgi:isocitrate/isopropylmalate dehydrogenase